MALKTWFLALVGWQCAFAQAAPEQLLKDDWGRVVAISTKPARVITLAAHLTEMALEAGLSEQLVAIDNFSRASKVKVVTLSAYPEPSIENIAKLKPDLVFLWGAGLKDTSIKRLESLGIKVFVSEPKSLDDIVAIYSLLVQLSKAPPRDAEQRILQYRAAIAPKNATSSIQVFVQVWSEPLMTVGTKTFIADALRHCGAELVLAPVNQSSAVVNPEAVVASRTRAVISTDSNASKKYWASRAKMRLDSWEYISLPESTLSQPSIKLIESLQVLCERLASLR